MTQGLKEEIAAFERLLPQIRREHGPSWTLITEGRLQGAYATFAQAAEEAERRFADKPCLIRHTDNVPASFPLLVVDR